AVIAPTVAFAAVGGLFRQLPATSSQLAARSWQRWAPGAWLALGILFAIGAAASTFLALRAAPVSFDRRGSDLEALGSRIHGKRVIFVGVDRFAAYRLRGTRVEAPGGYVPPAIEPRKQKPWLQGRSVDFDSGAP